MKRNGKKKRGRRKNVKRIRIRKRKRYDEREERKERLKMFHSIVGGAKIDFGSPLDSGNEHCSARSPISA